jgi:hypothetical protein
MTIDLETVLDELASPDRLARYIDPLPCNHNPWR